MTQHDTTREEQAEVIRDLLTPQAAATVVAYLSHAFTGTDAVDSQVQAFRKLLIDLVGGKPALHRLFGEIGFELSTLAEQ